MVNSWALVLPILLLGIVAILVVVTLRMGWRMMRRAEDPRIVAERVSRWHRRIDKLYADYRKNGDTRVYCLALAKLLRDFGTEVSGQSMASLSVTEVHHVSGLSEIAQLLRELEDPSFIPSGVGEVGQLTDRAKAAVGGW